MDTDEIVKRLRKLQIEQTNLLNLLAQRTTANSRGKRGVKAGDKIKLLTGGVSCCIGDLATVTKVKGSTVHFQVDRSGKPGYKHKHNVSKYVE